MRKTLSFAALLTAAFTVQAQTSAPESYLQLKDVTDLAAKAPGARTDAEIRRILPVANSQRFADYAAARLSFGSLRQSIEELRLNKTVATSPGPVSATSLVSRVSVPSVLGFAVEYGSVLQTSQGNISTLRGNLLGIARMALGQEQFPYCSEIDQKNCQPVSRWLRRISGVVSFASVRMSDATATAEAPGTPPTPVTLFGNDYRMASWGLRFDLTANDPNDPKYVGRWRSAVLRLRSAPQSEALTKAVNDLFEVPAVKALYEDWQAETVIVLSSAPQDDFTTVLGARLDILVTRLAEADPEFATRVVMLRRTFLNYATVRDELLRDIQSHRATLEYTNSHPLNQPYISNLRFIYSHQPSISPTLLTANFGMTWYHQTQPGVSAGRFRDIQLAGQVDRRLGDIGNFGKAVATFGAYYQWMKDDAVINIGPGNVALGSGIVLPNTAATLLGTKGHIAVVQGKLSIPLSGAVRIPVSVTWSNRTELINEKDIRGQVGLTLDVDSLFRR